MLTNLEIKDGKFVIQKQKISGLDKFKALIASRDPKKKSLIARANQEFVAKMVSGTTHVDVPLDNLSQRYANGAFIGDHMLPIVPVKNRSGLYFVYGQRDTLAYPDDAMGVRSTANEITKTRTTANYSVRDYALKDFLDVALAQDATAPLDEMGDLMIDVTNAVDFKHEARQSTTLTTAANYGGNTVALASGARWDTFTGAVSTNSPTPALLAAKAALWSGAGATKRVAFTTLNVWNALVQNTFMQDLFKFTKDGLLQPSQFGGYFGFDELWVAEARVDTANEGQSAAYARMWPDVFGIVNVALNPGLKTAAFGVTARVGGQRNTREWFDPAVGIEGGYWAQVGVSEQNLILSPLAGYLITTPVG